MTSGWADRTVAHGPGDPSMSGPTAVTCHVCGKKVTSYVHHQRLNVNVCFDCPLTDVMGEDISTHTVLWVRPNEAQA